MPLTIVMYHYVRPIAGGRYALKGLEIEQFAGQLDYLERHYRPITIAQLLACLDEGQNLPERALLLQFDDGYSDHFHHVRPELDRRRIQGTFFPVASAAIERRIMVANKVQFVLASVRDVAPLVAELETLVCELGAGRDLPSLAQYREQYFRATRLDSAEVIYLKRMLQVALPADLSGPIADRLFHRYVTDDEASFADQLYMSVDQLKALRAAGHHVGCHTESHPWMSSLTRAQQRAEIATALRLNDLLGLPRRGFTFCYPYGGYNDDSIAVLDELGCAAAFTAEVALADTKTASRLRLPRLDTIDLPMHRDAEPSAWTRRLAQPVVH